MVHLLWGSESPACWTGGHSTTKRHRHTPEQTVRKLREGDRLLNEGKDITEVVRHLEIAESIWNRWRAHYGGMKADEAAKRLRHLESENGRLKKLLAEAELGLELRRELPAVPTRHTNSFRASAAHHQVSVKPGQLH